MQLSIVIPTRHRVAQPARTVRALMAQIGAQGLAGAVEILLVQDGNPPSVAAALRAAIGEPAPATVRWLALPVHTGASAARNAGAEASRGAVVAFLDDDILPADDYVRATLQAHQRHPEALVINGTLRPLQQSVYAGFWFYHYDAVFNRPGEHFFQVAMLASGHVSVKRALLDRERPLYDPALTAREDYDLYLRLARQGIPSYKDDNILAFNDCRGTLAEFVRQRLWYGRGQEQLVAKHGAAFIASQQRQLIVPPCPRYWYLYLLLRVARPVARLHAAVRRRIVHMGTARLPPGGR